MATEYSTIETIQNYENLFKNFFNYLDGYDNLDKNSKLIYLSAGLGLSNSIHEKFIKSILYENMKICKLSRRKIKKLINKYKAPNQIEDFVKLLHLNLEEAFELNKIDIQKKYNIIDSVENLISVLNIQREIRNEYLHGDFNFHEDISFETFKDNIIDFQEIHNFILKIIRYSFLSNMDNLPDIFDNF